MKRYEIRAADENTVLDYVGFDTMTPAHASGWFNVSVHDKFAPDTAVLGIAEFETESEADKARLDWLDSEISIDDEIVFFVCGKEIRKSGQSVRGWIDKIRPVPKPTFTVIERSK